MEDQMGPEPFKFAGKFLNGCLFFWGEGSEFSTDSQRGHNSPNGSLQMLSPHQIPSQGQMFLCRGVVDPGETKQGTPAMRASTFKDWLTIRKHKGIMMSD